MERRRMGLSYTRLTCDFVVRLVPEQMCADADGWWGMPGDFQ